MDHVRIILMLSVGWDRVTLFRHIFSVVIAVKILAIVVRNPENIKGIRISGSETKLLQFADDTTVILDDLGPARALLKLLNDFEKIFGLKLNVMKTEAMWIRSLQNCEENLLDLGGKKLSNF